MWLTTKYRYTNVVMMINFDANPNWKSGII